MKSADFKKILSKELAPFLRQKGWKGTGFNYIKHNDNIIYALTIQPSNYGGKFCIELGVHFDFIPLKVEKATTKMKTWDMDIRTRLTPEGENDFWWGFPESENEKKKIFIELKELISKKGENYFNKYKNWESSFSKIIPQDIEQGKTKDLINITEVRTALLLARVNEYLKNNKKAIEFSEYGLLNIKGKQGSGLIPYFEEIIIKSR